MQISILVIENDPVVAVVIKKILQQDGFSVSAAYSQEQCLEILRDKIVHAIVLDVRVQDDSEIGFLRRLKSQYPALPVIVMTAYSTSFTETDAKQAGADAYFVKPFDLKAMLAKIKAVAGHPHRRRGT